MMVREGLRWCAALGVLSFAVGSWAQPAGVQGNTRQVSKGHSSYVDCQNPDTDLCSVPSPDASLYMYTVLTPDIPFDDLGAHWVVDLRKFPATQGAVKVLRVASNTGVVHSVHMKLLYGQTASARSARKPAPTAASTQPPAVPQPALLTPAATVVKTASRAGSAPTTRGETSPDPAASGSAARTEC